MKKNFWIPILFLVLFLILVKIALMNTSGKKQGPAITASYSEKTGQITVFAVRPSIQYQPYEYENMPEGDKIVSLSNRSTEGDTDIFVYNVLGNGKIELAFFDIDPQ
jgi:hypothetical protein